MPGGPLTPPKVSQKQLKALSFDKNHFCFDFFNIDFLEFFKLKGIFHTLYGCRGGFRYDVEFA